MDFLHLKAPFVELNTLLSSITPDRAAGAALSLAIGEPQHAPPAFVAQAIAEGVAAGGLGKYAPTRGSDELRGAISGWVARRFNTALDPEKHILPVCGTREALFLAAMLAAHRTPSGVPPDKAGEGRGRVFVPDPGYQCYTAAALGAGCEVVLLPCTKETGFLPDLDQLELQLKKQTATPPMAAPPMAAPPVAFYLCSPANPQGAVADRAYLKRAWDLACLYDFILITDECYAELYDKLPPPSALEVGAEKNFQNLLVFHSLSKRSNLPGLRSGFCAGDETLIQNFRVMRELGGVAMPRPTQSASAKVWADDEHVAVNRARYQEKFDLAQDFFGQLNGFYRPAGGFFLWFCLDDFQMDDIAMTKKLWQESAVRVLPGSYLSQGQSGSNFLRLALVAEKDKLATAFKRIAKTFNQTKL